MKAVTLTGVFIGKPEDQLSEFADKRLLQGTARLELDGLVGDQQGDLRFLGGPDRALLHYPQQHYAFWRQQIPGIDWHAPAFGENLSTGTIFEDQVCIGDLFSWGDAILQISQPGSPSHRLGERWGLLELPLIVQQQGRCGWFYRVLRAGEVSVDEPLQLIQRPYPGLTVAQAIRSFYHFPLERSGLHQLVSCQALSERWRQAAARRLASDRIEDWSARLSGDPRRARRHAFEGVQHA